MSKGPDRREFYKPLLDEPRCYPPQQISRTPILQLFALFGEDGAVDDGIVADKGDGTTQDRGEQLNILNRFRARHGLPPVKPREES